MERISMGLPEPDGWSIPFDSPYYAPLPAVYRNVTFHVVPFTSDAAAVSRLLPDPLEAAADGACAAMGMRIPFSSLYGAFTEAALLLRCTFRGQSGWYVSHVWHDGPAGIAAGREIYGTPKIFARFDTDGGGPSLLTRASIGEVPVISISTTADEAVPSTKLPSFGPSWRLKLIPRADGPGPALKQLIDASGATQDLVIHASFRGRGTVRLEASPLCDIVDLRPRDFGPAWTYEASYVEGFATIAHDYLAER
jgi:acetoacetate decarboxylase